MERSEGAPEPLRRAAAVAWRLLVIVAAIAVVAYALAALRMIFLPFVVALLLATLFTPPVQWLRERGVPSAVATLAVLLSTFLLVVGALGLAGPYLANEFSEFGDLGQQARAGVDRALDWAVEGPLGLAEGQVRGGVDRAEQQLREQGPQLAGGAVGGALLLVEMVIGAIVALVLLFFFLSGGREMWQWFVRLTPEERHDEANEVGQRIWKALSGYLRAQIVVAFVDAALIGALLVILGVPLAIPLAVLIFFGGFVPVVGAFVTGFLAVMVALATDGPGTALIVLAGVIIVQQLEGNVLEPYIVGRYIHLHPVAILLAVAAGAIVWGIPGAFLAVPLLAAVHTTASHLAQADEADEELAASKPAAGDPDAEAQPEEGTNSTG